MDNIDNAEMLNKIAEINKIEGFNPNLMSVAFTDLESGETRTRLPVMAQLAWFRLKYPEGKITVNVTPVGDCFVASARVYPNYKDPETYYLAEGTASRATCLDKPSVSPREWAQTAAIGVALRNAGFGLQFNIAGEDFSEIAPNELGIKPVKEEAKEMEENHESKTETEPTKELSLEEKYHKAVKVVCPLEKYKGKTLGDLLTEDPKLLNWLATKFERDVKVKEAAKVICEYAVNAA